MGFGIPYWLTSVFVAGGITMLVMNIYDLGDFPLVMQLVLFGLSALILSGAATEILLRGQIHPGFGLACVGPIGGIVLAFILDSK